MKKIRINFNLISGSKNIINPSRDWSFVLVTGIVLLVAITVPIIFLYFEAVYKEEGESAETIISRRSSVNETRLDKALEVRNSRQEKFSIFSSPEASVVDPSL